MIANILRIGLGIVLLVLGLIGLVLPVLQGGLFLILGLLLLSPDVPIFARLLCWIENRFPRLQSTVQRLRRFASRNGIAAPACGAADMEQSEKS